MPPAPKLTGALTENTRLRSTQQILKSRIVGPESIAIGSDGEYRQQAASSLVSIFSLSWSPVRSLTQFSGLEAIDKISYSNLICPLL